MNTRIAIPLTSLVLFSLIWCSAVFPKELSETKTVVFKKNVVVKKYKEGEVQAEPYTVKKGDSLWKILINNYGIKKKQYHFFCSITKSLNPGLKNAHEIVPRQVLLIPFKYVAHFKIAKKEFRSVLLDVLSSHPSQIPTEEYTFSKGEQLAQILKDKYNIPGDLIFNEYLNLVKKLNPEVKDINLLRHNQKIILPSFSSYMLSSEEEDEPEGILEEEFYEERTHAEEAFAAEELSSGRKIDPFYITPRFRKVTRKIPSDKTLYLSTMSTIADVMQGKLNSFGKFTTPLMKECQITINTNNFPILQLTDRKKVILNYGGTLSSGLIELIESELDDLRVINIRKDEDIESVLDKVISTAGYFSVDKDHNPLVIGNRVQFEIWGNWIIYKDELLEDIMVVNLIEKGAEPVDSQLKDYINTFGVNLVDLYMMGEDEQEKMSFPTKKADHTYRPEDIPDMDISDSVVLVDSLFTLLGQDFQKDFKIKLFRDKYDGFDIEVTADRYFERGGKRHIISFHAIPVKLTEVIVQQGDRFLSLSLSMEDPFKVIKSVLDLLYISYDVPRPRFSASSNGVKRVELIIPGILIKQDKETRVLLTLLELKAEIYQWLMAKKIKVVRLGTSQTNTLFTNLCPNSETLY